MDSARQNRPFEGRAEEQVVVSRGESDTAEEQAIRSVARSLKTGEARLLPETETWSVATWGYLRLLLLAFLEKRGARTTDELVKEYFAPGPAFYPLNRAEVAAVVESARRRGLLDENANPEPGVEVVPEWIPSDKGARLVQNFWAWAAGRASFFGRHQGLLTTVLGALGIGTLLAAQEGVVGLYLGGVACVTTAFALPVFWAKATGFAGRDDFVRDWSRLNLEREDWVLRWLGRRKPGWAAAATVAAIVGFAVATIFGSALSLPAAGFLLLAAIAYSTYYWWSQKQNALLLEAEVELERIQIEGIRVALAVARKAANPQ